LYQTLSATSLILIAPTSRSVGFDANDFIISTVNSQDYGVHVYDYDFTYKGLLASAASVTTGLDFNASGQLVARGWFNQPNVVEFIVFEETGVPSPEYPSFVPATPGGLDFKVGPNGNYFVASQNDVFAEPNGFLVLNTLGEVVNVIDEGDYEGVAVLPNGTVWGGGGSLGSEFLKIFDAEDGNQLAYYALPRSGRGGSTLPEGATPFDGGQRAANTMHYSEVSNTVLIGEARDGGVTERNIDGSFVRRFETNLTNIRGITRGPGGDIYVASGNAVVRFSSTGVLLDTFEVPTGSWNIVWGGNSAAFESLAGDYDGDGIVSQSDLDLVLLNWGADAVPGGWTSRILFDGLMSQNELDGVLLNWGDGTVPNQIIPEPVSVTLVLATTLIITRRRRSCRNELPIK